MVAASSSWQVAEEGAFSEAFIEAAAQLQKETGRLQPFIALEALIDRVNSLLSSRGRPQLTQQMPVTGSTGLAPFIPNRNYEPNAPPNVDVETARGWLSRQRDAELVGHWGPRSRGVEVAVQAGSYFTGRKVALQFLTDWLADPADDTRIRVVTGSPGSGKSALLGRLVTAENAKIPAQEAGSGSANTEISAALLAKGKTAAELLEELADTPGLGLQGPPSDRSIRRIVIDALDEASDPPSVIEKVISPLLDAASAGGGPRIVLATRPVRSLLALLPSDRVAIDLDAEPYSEPADVAGYVEKVLLAIDDPDSPTPYRYMPEVAHAVAMAIAAISGRSFLIARIAARTLARTPRILGPEEVNADQERWRDVGAAFDQDLARYGANAQRIRGLLIPLAWAEGGGLPRELWTPLATALDGTRVYTQDEVTSLLAEAGAYVVEALDNQRSVYRLYHQQFAEHLRAELNQAAAGRLLTEQLLQQVPVDLRGHRQWTASAPYIRAHLATHAAAGGLLDDLITDPRFLLAAASERLLPVLGAARTAEARRAGEAFRRARPWLSAGSSQLMLAALQVGAEQLAAEIMAMSQPDPGQWRAAWAWWRRPTPALTIATFDAVSARAIAVTRTEAAAVAVTAVAKQLESWDLDRGALLARRAVPAAVICLTLCDFSGAAAVAAGDIEGNLTIFSIPGLDKLAARPTAHPAAITTVAAADSHGILVTGDQEGRLTAWAIPSLQLRGQQPEAHTDVRQVEAITIGSELYVISAGDWAPIEGRPGDMPTLRMWSGTGLEPYASWAERRRLVSHIGVLNVDSRIAVLMEAYGLDPMGAELWAPDEISGGFNKTQELPGLDFAGLIRLSEVDYLICTPDGLIPLSAPRLGSDPVALGKPVETDFAHWAGPVATSQGDALVSATGTLRLWTLENLIEEAAPSSIRDRRTRFIVSSLAANEDIVYASTADGQAHAWDIGKGEARSLRVRPNSRISTMCALSDTERVILGLDTGELQFWDCSKGRLIWRVRAGEEVISVQVLPLENRMIVLAAARQNWQVNACRMWDLESGLEIESRDLNLPNTPLFKDGDEWNLEVAGYQRDKRLTDLSAIATAFGPLATVACRAPVIPVWSLETQDHVAQIMVRDASKPQSVAFAPGFLFGGGSDGELLGWRLSRWWPDRRQRSEIFWDKRAGYPITSPDVLIRHAHYGPVQAIVGGIWNGKPCVLSGGRDGRLQAWRVEGEHLATVDIGASVTSLVNAGRGRFVAGTERGVVMIESGESPVGTKLA